MDPLLKRVSDIERFIAEMQQGKENKQQYHKHKGIDSPRIDPRDLLGFPIFDAVPTQKAEEGMRVYANFGGFVYEYSMINRVWNLMSVSSAFGLGGTLSIGGGTIITKVLSATATLNFGAIAPNSSADLTMALVGALDGDSITIGVQNAIISTGTNCTNISFFAWVSASGVVTIRCTNHDLINTANPASGVFRSTVIQF